MPPDGFAGFTQGVTDATRRGLLELKRLIGEKVSKSGDTMTGQLSIADSTNQNMLRLIGGAGQRTHMSIHGGSDGERKLYLGYPHPTSDKVYLFADDGDLQLLALSGRLLGQDSVSGSHNLLPDAWTDVTFQNTWSNWGGTWQTCQYRLEGDLVRIRGMIGGGVLQQSAFTLPVGKRPPKGTIRTAATSTGYGEMRVASDGTVKPWTGSNLWFNVDCTFAL